MRKKGQLPCGIEIDGTVYRDYELREQFVADEIEVLESEHGPRAIKTDSYYNICLMARRLALVGLDKPVTPEMVMGMLSDDFTHLLKSSKAMSVERDSFRGAAEAAPDAASGPVEVGI